MTAERCIAVAIDSGEDTQELDAAGQPVARRVCCTISDGLLRMGDPEWSLKPSVRAALLWRAYRRYSELVGLKKLTGGLSGSDVLVFRPKLKPPAADPDHATELATAGPTDVLAGAWGSPLLVKTGKESELRKEWVRFNRFLRDRQSPFIAHLEELLVVHPAPAEARVVGDTPGLTEAGHNSGHGEPLAVLIGSFLGGDVVQAEPLDKVIRGTRDTARCLRLIDQVFAHLATWHTNPQPRPLADWSRVFHSAAGPSSAAPWLLFGRYNFRKEVQASDPPAWDLPRKGGEASLGRLDFAADLRWDVPFAQRDHLSGHLLGRGAEFDGLLVKLLRLPVQFSLIHGDLNPRNVLCDAGNTWLIDFEHTGVGPVLADFARLEVNLRFWCIELAAATANAGQAAEDLERLLLAHFHGSESSLEPVRRFAQGIGADPDDLEKIARCVVRLRQLARRWCVTAFVDGRDYLAVLYLTLTGLLPAAAKPDKVAAANVRWGVGLFWVLEEALDRVLGREPFARGQTAYSPLRHVSAGWLRPDGAAGRVHYLCGTADGQQVLAAVASLTGVLQGGYHHLDAYRHTLAVLTYLEAILSDPVAALLNPATLDDVVSAKLVSFGLPAVPLTPEQAATEVNAEWFTPAVRAEVSQFLSGVLTADATLLLKWCGLLHDVGKPGTRTVRAKGGVEEVQFIGHEVYGLSVVREELRAWFPKGDRERLGELMRNHHTSHQLLGNKVFADENLLDGLRRLHTGGPHSAGLKLLQEEADKAGPDLPLLLLHGYADRMAARGVKQTQPVAAWAEATLAVLAGLAALPRLQAAAEEEADRDQRITDAARRYAGELGLGGQAVGRLRSLLAGRTGTAEDLLGWLRERVSAADLTRPPGGAK